MSDTFLLDRLLTKKFDQLHASLPRTRLPKPAKTCSHDTIFAVLEGRPLKEYTKLRTIVPNKRIDRLTEVDPCSIIPEQESLSYLSTFPSVP